MSDLNYKIEQNPFNFIPMPLEIEPVDYPYWMAFITDFLVDNTPTLVHLYGHPSTFNNQSFEKRFGGSTPQLTLNYLFEHIVANSDVTAEELIDKASNGEVIEGLNFDYHGNELVNITCNLLPLRLGSKIIGYKFQILNDEEKLKRQTQELNDLVELMRLVISGLSHDAKNNLTTIATSVYLIQRRVQKFYKIDDPLLNEKVAVIERQVQDVNAAIDLANSDLVSTAEFDNAMGWFPLLEEILDIQFKCESLIQQTKPENSEVYLEVNVDNIPKDFKLFSNKQGLSRVLINLIGNAIKYSKENFSSKIIVDFEFLEKELIITIKDEGIGIPEDFASVAFKQFARADNALHQRKGTGVGLMIVKMFIDKMHGAISYDSQENVGTTFTIRLPLDGEEITGYVGFDEA